MMNRSEIVVIPYVKNSVNKSVSSVINILSRRYDIVGGLHDYTDISGMLRTKAVFLSWVEEYLDNDLKRKIMLHKLFGARIVWMMHNKFPHKDGEKKKENILWLMKNATDIVVYSVSSIEYLPKEMRSKAFFVPHIMFDVNYNERLKIYIKKMYKISDDSFIYLYFGSISPYKNIESLVDAFCDVESPDAVLLIVGMTERQNRKYATYLKDYIKKDSRIRFDPREIPEEVLNCIIDLSDVVVLPFLPDSYLNSGTMIHAFSAGKPVISPVFPMAEDYKEKGIIHIYENNLIVGMKEAIYDKERNKRMGISAKDYMNKNNSFDMVLKSFTNLLEGK